MASNKPPEGGGSIEPLSIEQGLCHVIFVYDAARAINLDATEIRLSQGSQRQTIRHKRPAPSYFEYQPPPLRVTYEGEPFKIGQSHTRTSIDLILYDFGAVEVLYTIPINKPFYDLLFLSEELYDNQVLLNDSRLRVDQLLKVLGDAVTHARLAPMVEDYVVFQIESFNQAFDATRFCTDHRHKIAQILRAERRPLSEQETEDALAARISYGMEDLTVVDWNAALLIDRQGDDVLAVLEFGNVELLEMRYLDQKLDLALDQSYEKLSRRPAGFRRLLGDHGADLRSLAELQVDNATLFEGVNNAVKLLGDQYLARTYRLMARRFHLDAWDASILRKLETLDSIYQKMSDQGTNRRMEVLEWIIIILFVFSIALELIHLT